MTRQIPRRTWVRSILIMTTLAGAATAPSAAQWGREGLDPERLPLPFGIGITLYDQDQDLGIQSLRFDLPGVAVNPSDVSVSNEIEEVNLKLDAWILPFLNAFAIVGELDGLTEVDISRVQLPLPFPLPALEIRYDGDVYGGGLTFAYGGDRWFASVTGIYTETDLSGDFQSTAEAFVVTPKVGLVTEHGALWVGAMFQEANESHQGTIALPFLGPVDFAVDLAEQDQWNGVVGVSTALSRRFHLEMEVGFGDRSQGSLAATYRF